ncbi:MAG: shikimate kinase [Thermosynechococcaceae cyanobacterium]
MSFNDLSLSLKGINVYLIGMMGCGKSTAGHLLAQRLGYRFLDSDAVIVQATGCSIAQLFAESGETAFRAIETQVLSELAAHTRLVVATGGGIVLERANWGHLQQGLVVWLDASADILWQRLKHDTTRPLLQTPNPKQTLQVFLDQRQPLYAQADLRIEIQADDSPDQVVDRILETMPDVLKP